MKERTEDKLPTTDRGVNLSTASQKVVGKQTSIDWLTCTTANEAIGMGWFDIWLRLATDNGMEFASPWQWMGYEGSQTEGSRWGKGPQGFILIASGRRAHEVFMKVDPGVASITRMDIATTVLLETDLTGLVRAHYNSIPNTDQKRNFSLITNKKGGETLYVGSRQSAHYGRVYDKGAERGEKPGWLFRYEVVLKKPYARTYLRDIHSWIYNRSLQSAMDRASVLVWDWFNEREVTPVYLRSSFDEIVVEKEIILRTEEKKLAWLQRSVSPTVKKLLQAGRRKDVVEALELENFLELPGGQPADIG